MWHEKLKYQGRELCLSKSQEGDLRAYAMRVVTLYPCKQTGTLIVMLNPHKTLHLALLAAALLTALAACTRDGETVWIDDSQLVDDRPTVVFVCMPDQLGDMTYNDEIYRGVASAASRYDMLLRIEQLEASGLMTLGDAIDIFLRVENQYTDATDRTLVVWCNDGWEDLLRERAEDLTANPAVTHLLVESTDTALAMNTLSLSLYATCYQTGLVISGGMDDVESVALVGADGTDAIGSEMRRAFREGVQAGREGAPSLNVTDVYLSGDGSFNVADSVYRLAFSLADACDLWVPLTPETAQGLLRYNRERGDASPYTVGIDCDMRPYSARVPLSMTRSLAATVEEWIGQWVAGETPQRHLIYGLESGHCGITVSTDYSALLSPLLEATRNAAILKEREHLKQK